MPDEARQLAQETLYTLWTQRERMQTTLSRAYAHLEPGDRVNITSRGVSYNTVITNTSYGEPGILEITATIDAGFTRAALGAIGSTTVVTSPQPHSITQPTSPFFLNLSALHASDVPPRFHISMVGVAESWPGATLYRSTDSGTSYTPLVGQSVEGFAGHVALLLPPPPVSHVVDDTNTIVVVMDHGTLLTTTDTNILAGTGENLVAIGGGNTWEILSFRTATLIAENTYELSHLFRGRRGTEWATTEHVINTAFVVIDSGLTAVGMTLVDRYVVWPYKTVSVGQGLGDVTPGNFEPTAENLIPWTVIDQTDSIGAGGTWTLNWCYRSRFGGDWVDGVSVAVAFDIDFIGFEVIIYADNTFTTVKRTIMTNGGNPLSPGATKYYLYLASLQIVDFGALQTTLYYTVASVSTNTTGRSVNMTGT
jgi:hypothetical protein